MVATAPEPQLLQECVDPLANYHPGVPWESTSGPAAFERLLARKAAIAAKGKGPISVGYVVYLTRQKTRRPDLTLGKDWQAGLADRCTARQLTQIPEHPVPLPFRHGGAWVTVHSDSQETGRIDFT